MADEADIISREDLNSNKNIFLEQQLYAMKIADIYHADVRKRLTGGKKFKAVFPSSETLYNKDIVKEMDPAFKVNRVVVKKPRHYSEDKPAGCGAIIATNGNSSSLNNYINVSMVGGNNISSPTNKINSIIEEKPVANRLNETTSTSSKDEGCSNEGDIIAKNIDQVFKAVRDLFTIRERSRFEFVKRRENREEIEVPKFIKDLIVKKVSRHKLTKYIKQGEDILYSDNCLESEFRDGNPWAQFIYENKEAVNDDWEFIQDFDYINSLILDKRKAIR
jgi:hypothetical protein